MNPPNMFFGCVKKVFGYVLLADVVHAIPTRPLDGDRFFKASQSVQFLQNTFCW